MRINTSRSIAMLAGVALCASAAFAAAPVVRFTIGTTPLSLPQPAGFCLPDAGQAPLADANASADIQNDTVASLLGCNRKPEIRPWSNYVLIKTPKALINRVFDKASALDELAGVFSGPNSPKFDDKDTQGIANDTERALGMRIEITGTFGYAGRDADCVYLAGPMQAEVSGRIVKGLVATCMTVAGGKLISVNLYQIAENPDVSAIKGMKAQARAIGVSIHR